MTGWFRQAVTNATSDQLPAGEMRSRLAISVDTSTRSLIVTGSPGDVQTAEDIVRQLEQGREPIIARQPRIFEMRDSEELGRVTPLVEQLYKEQVDEAGTGPADAIILRDENTHRLIVRAKPDHLGQIEKLISELRLAKPLTKPRTTVMLPLANRKVDQVYRNIESLVNDRMGETPFRDQPKPRLIEDRVNNRVIVTANVEQHEVVAQVVQSLDVLPDAPERTMRFVDLDGTDAAKVTPLISRLFDNEKPGAGPAPQVIEDTGGERLIVLSTEEQHQRITAFLEKYQSARPVVVAREMRVISLPRREPGKFNQALQSIQKLIDQQMQNPKFVRIPKPMILPDEPGSRLVMTATKEQFAVIEQIVATVTAAPEPVARQMRVLRLEDRNAAEMLELAKRLFDKQISPDGTKPEIFTDKEGTRLIVVGTDAEYRQVEKMVSDYSSGREDLGPHQVKIVSVPLDQADSVVQSVSQLYQAQMRDNPGRLATPAILIADSENDRIIISGPQKEVAQVEQLVNMLGTPNEPNGGQRVTQVVRLGAANAKVVSGLIEKSFNAGVTRNKLTLLVDEASNSLVLTGPEKSVAAAEAVIRELDTGDRQKPVELRILELRAAQVAKVAPIVTQLFETLMKDRHGAGYTSKSKIITDEAGNRLIITGQPEEIDEIDKLVKQLDSTTRQSAGNRIFQIKVADAKRIADIINKTFVTIDSRGNTRPRLNVAADEASNILIVAGPPEDIQAVGMIVEQLDVGNPFQPKELKVIELPHAEGEKLAQLAGRVWGLQMRGVEGNGDVTFIHEPSGKRLVIVAPATLMDRAGQIVNGLLVSPESSNREVVVIELKHAKSSQVVTVLSSAYEAKVAGLPGVPASILAGANDKQIVVMGTPAQIAEIQGMATKLDTAPKTVEKVTESFSFSSAEQVTAANNMIQNIYEKRHEKTSSDPADAIFLADAPNRRMVVVASSGHIEEIRELIKTFQAGIAKHPVRQSKSLPLANVKAAEAMTVLSQVFSRELASSEPGSKLILTPSVDGESLFMEAPERLAKRVESLLALVDQPGETVERSIKLIQVGDAAEVQRLQPMVTQIYKNHYEGNDKEPADAQIIADPVTGTLVVSGRKNHVLLIEKLVAELGLQETQDRPRVIRVYDLKNTQAETLATTVTLLYEEKTKGRPGVRTEQVLVLPDAATNRLIVMATDDELLVIEKLISQVDQVSLQTAGTRVFKLRANEASEVARIIQQSLVNIDGGGNTSPKVSVAADPKSNTLIVSGEPEDMQAAAMIIEQLDNIGGKPDRAVRVFTLLNTKAETAALQAKSVYLDQMKGRSELGASDAMILPDASGRRLIVTASKDQLPLIEQVISVLDEETAITKREMVVHSLENASAVSITSVIANVFSAELAQTDEALKMSVTASADDRSLVVSGQPEDLAKVAEMVKTLDAPSFKGEVEVRSYRLVEGRVGDLATALNKLFQRPSGVAGGAIQPRFEADEETKHLLVAATQDQFKRIEKLIQDFQSSVEVTHGIRTFRLVSGNAEETAKVLREMLDAEELPGSGDSSRSSSYYRYRYGRSSAQRDKVRITAALAINAVIVQGTPSQLALADELVKTLESMERPGESVMEVVHLEKAEAASVADAVNRALRGGDDRRSSSSRSRSSSSSSSNSQKKTDVTVTPEVNSNSLLIVGPVEAVKTVTELVRELDVKSESEGGVDIRVYKLENGKVKQVSQMLEDMIERVLMLMPGDEGDRSRRRYSVRTWALEETNTLFVLVPPRQVALVEQLLPMLDQKTEEAKQQGEIKFHTLKYAEADDVGQVVEDIIDRVSMLTPGTEAERRARQFSVRFWAHDESNTLLSLVPPEQEALAEKLIKLLDTPRSTEEGMGEIKLFPLKYAEAKAVGSMLENMVEQVMDLRPNPGTNRRDLEGRVNIWHDEKSNSLFILVPPSQLPLVKQLLALLDKKPERIKRDIHYVLLENADAITVASQIQALFVDEDEDNQPIIEADLFTNSITIIATREQIAEMNDTIAQLDEAAMDNTLQIRVISAEGVPAKDLAEMLTGLYSKLSGANIRLVEELPEVVPQTEQTPGKTALEEEIVYIAVDEKINAVLASGKAKELDRISRLVNDLTITIMDSEAEFRRYELKEADPEGLAKALLDIYARPEKTVIEDGKPTKVPQPPKIVAVPDLRTRSVIVRAEPLDFEIIDKIVKELDVKGVPRVDMRFFILRNAKPEDAITHLEDFFKELKEVRPGEPLEAKADKRTKSVVVVARPEMFEKIGEVIERIDVPPEFAVADVLILELRKANAQTLSVILQDMIRPDSKGNLTDEAQAMVEQVQKLNITNIDGQVVQLDLTKPIKVFGESGDGINRLVITSTADNMVALRELVRVMDTVSIIDGVTIRIVTLENAEADNVRDTLSGIFSQSQALGQGPGGKAEPEGSGGRALVNQINIGADDRTNSIIMSGHPDSVDLAERLIVDLDKDVENFVTDVKVYRLKHASTDQIVPMLQSVFKENSSEPSLEGISRQVTRLRLHLEDNGIKVSEVPATRSALTIQGDDSTNTIIVAARSDLLPLIEAVINTLDIPAAGGMESIRIYPLEHANAATIQNVLENLFQGQPRGQVRPEDRPNIVIDSRTNALIIAASQKTLAIVTSLIMRLDQKPENPGILIEVLPLDHNDASQVAGMINDVFSARRRNMLAPGQTAQSQERVNVEADGLTNSLIITASKENVLLIRELVAKLDLEPTAETSQLTIIPLEYVDAQRAGAMLRSLIKQGLYRPGISRSGAARASRESIAISVDHATNTLIISASPENLAVVREVVKQIDTKNYAKAGTLKVYELKYASAPRLARTLDSFFRAKRLAEASLGDADAIVPVTVTHDERTNTLLITGGKESFAIIDELLAKLDADAVMAQNKFDVFPLTNSSAVKVKSTLDRLFTGRTTPPGGQAPQAVTIIADSISNSLVIGAATEDLPMVRDLIERLDEEQASPDINVAVFPLAKANATSVSQIIMSLYRDSGTATGPSVAVNVDDRINALVVSAGVNDLKRIEELAKQLDTDQLKRVSEIRVFGLKYARATELALLLNTALNTKPENLTSQSADRQELLQFITRTQEKNDLVTTGLKEGVLITPDPRTNSLVVSAPVDNMPLIEQLIAKLDSSSPQIAQIKVFQLTNADARQMADVLSTLFRLQSAGGQANTRSIRYTLVMPTDGAAANANGEPTIGTAQENALTVTVDVRTNSLLIGGSEHYVALSSQIIEELDSSPAQERITKVYRLKNSQAESIAEALQAFLDQAQQRVTSVLGAEAVGTAQRLLDEEVAIVAEPISNSLLVSASPRYFEQVQAMIEELDQPQKQVLIQVLLAEVTLDGSTEWGMQWQSDMDLTEKDIPVDTASVNSRFGLDPSSAMGGLTTTLTGDNWGFILKAMQSDGRLEILSRPQILAVDNQVASIEVGQRVPVVTGSRVTERGDSINTFEYQSVGIQLEVTPRINPDGIVKMDVSPTISSLSSSSVAISSGFTVPIINNRSATTTVSVQDGQTIVIGGLISTEDNERITKIPWLGDIPYIGAAFRRTKKTRVRSELLIILTPHVINDPGEAEKFSRENIDSSNIFEQFQDTETERNRTQRRILDSIKPKAREEKGVEVPQPGKEKEPLPSKI